MNEQEHITVEDVEDAYVKNELKPMGDVIADSLEEYFREHGFDVRVEYKDDPL